ncbi:hypothetical protein DFH94DRAFT_767120 [Russula ochroleuca]|uniref:Secreted protein n=1 Tax=Russula ochroleuca TaxID=152965 RepID=A0A9P5MQX9_9AGAM|nr:hypothetical protein DFH94DRAFT_767120 [Russula ochroleuca]
MWRATTKVPNFLVWRTCLLFLRTSPQTEHINPLSSSIHRKAMIELLSRPVRQLRPLTSRIGCYGSDSKRTQVSPPNACSCHRT